MFDKDKNEKEEMKKTKNNSSDNICYYIFDKWIFANDWGKKRREEKAAYDSISSRPL